MNLELSRVEFSKEEISEVIASLTSGFVTMGEKVELFEKKFAEYIGVRHAVMVNSGSSANLVMMKAMREQLGPGARVLVPALSWSTTLWPVIQSGLTPVLMDVDPETLNVGPDQLSEALRWNKAQGMVVVHIMGNPAPMEQLMRGHNLVVVEDSCETLGSTYQGRKTGTNDYAGSFSFYYSHHMTTIEGGMVVTDSTDCMEKLLTLRSHGWSRAMKTDTIRKWHEDQHPSIDPRFLFVDEGYNLRPTELNAAIGLHQLDKLDEMNNRRQEIEIQMRSIVGQYGESAIQPITVSEDSVAYLFAFPVMLKDSDTRNAFSTHLEANGIQTRPIVAGNLARHPAFKNKVEIVGDLPGANKVADCGLYWGLHPQVTDDQLEHLEKVIGEYFQGRIAA